MAKEGTFRANAPFAAVLFLFLGTFHPLCPAGGRGRGHLPVVHGRFHPLCPTDGRPDTSPRAPRDRGDATRQLHSDPRVQAQASSLLKSTPAGPRSPPAGPRSPPAGPRSPPAGQDLHRPGPLDAGPAQIHMSPHLDPQTGRISRSRRRRPGPSTLPGPFDPVPALRGRATTSDRRRRITSGSPRPPKRRWERRRAE